jgi:pimeloyl-ACP methyl ester carboxylesterase
MAHRSSPVGGFELAYDRHGSGPPVVLLHGWPGDRTDYRALIPLLADHADVVVPDLRGFGESDKHPEPAADAYSVDDQVRSVVGLMEELGLGPAVIAGYDVGSPIAQTLARRHPEAVHALVLAPPMPGAGARLIEPGQLPQRWYQDFHRLDLAEQLLDGDPVAVRANLAHFWSHWSGPGYEPEADALDHLAEVYGAPGAFVASISWYRARGSAVPRALAEQAPAPEDRLATPITVLWPEHDPLFPRAWGDRLDEFFADVTLRDLEGAGHFSPLEAPEQFASAIRERLSCLVRSRTGG